MEIATVMNETMDVEAFAIRLITVVQNVRPTATVQRVMHALPVFTIALALVDPHVLVTMPVAALIRHHDECLRELWAWAQTGWAGWQRRYDRVFLHPVSWEEQSRFMHVL